MSSTRKFILPSKVDSYLATLNRIYEKNSEAVLRNIVVNGSFSIHEDWDANNWNNDKHGHSITFVVSEKIYLELLDSKDDIQYRLLTDINKLNGNPSEYICQISIEMKFVASDRWREDSGIYQSPISGASSDTNALDRIWDSHHLHVFLSHKATCKVQTSKLKKSLARCGIASFVAHEDIEPTEEWHREIEMALFSMDALVALLSIDFHNSNWTDQEVGVAIGRGVPSIAVRLGLDPYGLMGKNQGLGGCDWNDTDEMARKIFELLYKRIVDKSRLFECALSAYVAAKSFDDSTWIVDKLLSIFESPSQTQCDRLYDAYRKNSQNSNSFKGTRLLHPLLGKWTGQPWKIVNHILVLNVK